jgi:hypothetical protein
MASFYFGFPVLCVLAIAAGAVWAAPSFAAMAGHGTPGTITAEWCQPGTRGGCQWYGRFVSDDGSLVRDDQGMRGVNDVGQRVRAIYTGDKAYPEGGGTDWLLFLLGAAGALTFLILHLVKLTIPALRYSRTAMSARDEAHD